MENLNFEHQNENIEKIKEELHAEWDAVIDNLTAQFSNPEISDEDVKNLVGDKFNGVKNDFKKITAEMKEQEFEQLMDRYEKQKRSLAHYKNLKSALRHSTSDIKKLAHFYKNIVYHVSNEPQKNSENSISFAEPFLNFLLQREVDKMKFRECLS
jgi:hypothetical protein